MKTEFKKFNTATIKELSLFAKAKKVYFTIDKSLNVIAHYEEIPTYLEYNSKRNLLSRDKPLTLSKDVREVLCSEARYKNILRDLNIDHT